MSQSNKKKKQAEPIVFCGGNFALIPIISVIFIVPLIMRAYFYDSGLSKFNWFPDRTDEIDIFLFWKGIILIAIAAIMTIILAVKLAKDISVLKKNYWIYFLAGYAILTLLSTLLSPNRNYGFTGIYEQFESLWVVLAYCVVTFYTYMTIQDDNDLRVVRKALFYLLVVICVIGITQLVGKDFFESDLGRRLLVSESRAEIRDLLTFTFSGSGGHQVYMTLYNPNYVGVFTSLILPIAAVLVFATKKWPGRIAWGCITLLLFLCTLGSGSKTFLLSLLGVGIIAIVFNRKLIVKYYKIALVALILLIGSAAIYFNVINLNVFQYVKNAMAVQKTEYAMEDFKVLADRVEITYNQNTLNVQYAEADEGVYFVFSDGDGAALQYATGEDYAIRLQDDRFEGLSFSVYAGNEQYTYFIAANFQGTSLMFTSSEDGYKFVNSCGKVDEIVPAKSAVFTDFDHFASGRGYIWSRSIPLLGKYFVLGSGADTFSIAFPQQDYVGRANAGYGNLLVTKPHNLYLQIGVQHGTLALICFLVVCAIYLIQSCKLYWKTNYQSFNQIFGLGIALGITGYLISGLANDSSVAVAPLFWLFLGAGFAINRMNRNERSAGNPVPME